MAGESTTSLFSASLLCPKCNLRDNRQRGGASRLYSSEESNLSGRVAGNGHFVFTSRAIDACADQKPENQNPYKPHLVEHSLLVIRAAV